MERKMKGRPPRLGQIFQKYDRPLYFVTFNTLHRRKLLDRQAVFDALIEYGRKNEREGRAIGRFVIMPDHIHLFVGIGVDTRLNDFIRLLKQALTQALKACGEQGAFWQPGFFDHLLRSWESYSEKWYYVRENPVRAGLVEVSEDWAWQGEIVWIDRV